MVKPAEDAPLSCIQIIKILKESGLPSNRCFFVMPENLELASKIVSDKRIDFLSFIGSSKVGWMLRSKLSSGTRCTRTWWNGSSFLTESTNIDLACKLLTKGGFYHSGQVCVSVQKIFVHQTIIKEFLDKFESNVKKLKIGDPISKNSDMGPLIRPSEVDRVENWVNEANIMDVKSLLEEIKSQTHVLIKQY